MDGAKWIGDEIRDRILGDLAIAEKGDRAVSSEIEVIQPEYENKSESGMSSSTSSVDESITDGSIPDKGGVPDDSSESESAATLTPTPGERQSGTTSWSGLLVTGLLISANVLLLLILVSVQRLIKKLDLNGQHINEGNLDIRSEDSVKEGVLGLSGKGEENGDDNASEEKEDKDADPVNTESTEEPPANPSSENQNPDLKGDRNKSPGNQRKEKLSDREDSFRHRVKRYLKVGSYNGDLGAANLTEVAEGDKDAYYVLYEDNSVGIKPGQSWYKDQENDVNGINNTPQHMPYFVTIVKLDAVFELMDLYGQSIELNGKQYVRIVRMEKAARVEKIGNTWSLNVKGKLLAAMD